MLVRANCVLVSVETQERALLLHNRIDLDGPAPDTLQRPHDGFGIVTTQVNALVVMAQKQLGAVVVIGVDHVDDRIACVGQLKE